MDEETRKKLARAAKKIEAVQKETHRHLYKISEQFAENLRKSFRQIGEVLKTLPEDQKKLHKYLSSQGWFLPPDFMEIGSIKKLAQLIEANKQDQVESWIQNYIKETTHIIKNGINDRFPERAEIINTAIEAYEEGKYILSIPTLLAQADGMFYEIMETTFYSNKEKDLEKIRRKLIEKLSEEGSKINTSSFGFLMVSQLKEESILHENYSDLDDYDSEEIFNRHLILHGQDLEYSSELNSLKAIALIGFLSDCKDILE